MFSWFNSRRRILVPVAAFLGALLSNQTAEAAISFVQQSASHFSGNSGTLAFTSNTTAGDLILVGFYLGHGSAVSAVTDIQGNAFSQIGTLLSSSDGKQSAALFYAKNIRGGTDRITVTLNTVPQSPGIAIYIFEYKGVDTVAPLDGTAQAQGSSSSVSSGNLTTTVTGDLLFGFCISDSSCTKGTGFTSRSTYESNLGEDKALSTAGNASAIATSSAPWTMQAAALKPASADTTPPTVPTGLTATPASTSQINLAWTASTDPNSPVAGYKIYRNSIQVSTVTGTSYSDTGLATNTTYSYAVSAYDPAGNTSAQSSAVTAATLPDTTPPSVPTGLAATPVSTSQINLSWTASTDPDSPVAGYNIYRNSTPVGTATDTSYLDTSLIANTTYSYTVSAYDPAGNTSVLSSAAAATTYTPSQLPSTPGWFQLNQTNIRSVCPPNGFGGSGYNFTDLCNGVTEAWSGGVMDTARNRLIVWGGGHNNYSGNELYSLDLNALTVTRITDPGVPVATACPEALVNDSQPNSRETYGGIAYMPNVDKMFAFGGSLATCGDATQGTWLFNFHTNQWEVTNPSGPLPRADYGIVTAYDPNTGQVLLHDSSDLYSYNPFTNAYTKLTSYDTPYTINLYSTAVIDPVRKQFVILGKGESWIYDISGNTFNRQTLSTTGGTSIVDSDSPGLEYDPVSGKIVAWNGGDAVYSLDLATNTWTAVSYYTGGPSAVSAGTFGRWRYSQASGVFITVNYVDDNAYTFRLDSLGPPDTTAPSIPTGLTATPVSTSQINLSWTASTDPDSPVAGYKVDRNSIQVGTAASTFYSDTGLAANTAYSYTVSAYDPAGNVSAQSSAVSAATPADTTPPSLPTALTATPVSTSQINLSWTASTDSDSLVAGYKIYRNRIQVGTTATPSYSDTGLSPSTSYSYAVSAYDAAGNDSGQSNSVSATTRSLSTSSTPTLVQAVNTSNTKGNPVNVYTVRLPNATLSGNCVIVAVQSASTQSGAGALTVSDDGGNTYTLAKENDDGNQLVSIFYALNAVGAQTITLSFSGTGSTYVAAVAAEFYNVATTAALDGTSANNATSSSVAAGSLTTTADNDLIFQYAAQETDGINTKWTHGVSPWALLTADYFDAQASQYEIQAVHGAINPTLSQGSSKTFNSVGIALKSAIAGTAPFGIRVVHMMHNHVPAIVNGSSFTLQSPSTGNLLVTSWIGVPGCDIKTVSDGNSNSYISTGPVFSNEDSGDSQLYYVASALTSTNLSGPTIATTGTGCSAGGSTAMIYDIAGSAASPYDAIAGRATASGNQTVSGILTTVSITPSTANGLIITQTGVASNTLTGVTPGNFLTTVPTPDIATGAIDNNNGWALDYNSGANPITFAYTTNGNAVGAWASVAGAFKSAN